MADRKRRHKGEGSVHRDQATGLWVATLELPPDGTGRRRRRAFRAKTRREVLERLRDAQSAVERGLPVGDGATTGQWLAYWAQAVVPRAGLAPATVDLYQRAVTGWIVPYVGTIRLRQLEVEHVEAMMAALEARGLSAGSVGLVRTILRRSLADAMRRGRLHRNVASLAAAPKQARGKIDDALDYDQTAKVLEAARGDRLEALAVLVLMVGLRKGEALDLRWSDIDLDAGTLTVAQAKTPAGRRTIALPAPVVAALRRHRARQREERIAAPVWVDETLVFTDPAGRPIPPWEALKWWHRLTIGAGVGRRRFHASRHTAATLMLNNGVDLDIISATLGHASLTITADIYAKVRPSRQRKAADAMEELFGAGGGAT